MKCRIFFVLACCATAIITLGAPAWGAEYEIDGAHSSLVFKARHYGASNVYGMIGFDVLLQGALFGLPNLQTTNGVRLHIGK